MWVKHSGLHSCPPKQCFALLLTLTTFPYNYEGTETHRSTVLPVTDKRLSTTSKESPLADFPELCRTVTRSQRAALCAHSVLTGRALSLACTNPFPILDANPALMGLQLPHTLLEGPLTHFQPGKTRPCQGKRKGEARGRGKPDKGGCPPASVLLQQSQEPS